MLIWKNDTCYLDYCNKCDLCKKSVRIASGVHVQALEVQLKHVESQPCLSVWPGDSLKGEILITFLLSISSFIQANAPGATRK